MDVCKVRAAAYKALACYKAADLEEAQLLRPLKEYGLLLLEETDDSALQQCSELIQSMLQYEHSIRRRYGTSTQAHADLIIIVSESATSFFAKYVEGTENSLLLLCKDFDMLEQVDANSSTYSQILLSLQKSDSGIGPMMPKQCRTLSEQVGN